MEHEIVINITILCKQQEHYERSKPIAPDTSDAILYWWHGKLIPRNKKSIELKWDYLKK